MLQSAGSGDNNYWNYIPATNTSDKLQEFSQYAYNYFLNLKQSTSAFYIQGCAELALHLIVPSAILVYINQEALQYIWAKKYNNSEYFANRYPTFEVYMKILIKYIYDFCPFGYTPIISVADGYNFTGDLYYTQNILQTTT